MEKYLYLTKTEWTNPWVNGGPVPLNLASVYKRMDRDGIYTPDENLIYDSPIDLNRLYPFVSIGGNVKDITISMTHHGRMVLKDLRFSRYEEDGVIISLCNTCSSTIARRFKKEACVKIFDVDQLKSIFDQQLGVVGQAGLCSYTTTHERNHFLKSTEDQWQDEFRIFWPLKKASEVLLPAGVAEVVKMD